MQPGNARVATSTLSTVSLASATNVRAFYLDIAQWALEDPARWAPWAVPCPVSEAETQFKKTNARRKTRMDQRTRERLPLLPALVDAAVRRLVDARLRLEAVRAARPGDSFAVGEQSFTKAGKAGDPNGGSYARAYNAAGRRRDFALAEHRAFWAWAAVEFLRHTGCFSRGANLDTRGVFLVSPGQRLINFV